MASIGRQTIPTSTLADVGNKLAGTSWGQLLQKMWSAAQLPHDAYFGQQQIFDPVTNRPDTGAVNRAADLAGSVTLGAGAMPAEVDALRMGLPLIARRADGAVDLGAVMKDVERGGLNRYPQRPINQAVDAQNWTTADVPIRSLYATQSTVNPDFASAAAARGGDALDLPLVVRTPDGKMYVRDGHHRLTALADQNAQTAKVRLIDLAPPPNEPQLPFGDIPKNLTFGLGKRQY